MQEYLNEFIEKHQARLIPYAYHIMGDWMEAEDIVQEVLSGYVLADTGQVQNAGSYLTRSVINRAINEKKRLRRQMEVYPGEWLPTPVFGEENILTALDSGNILDYSLMVLMEQLGPKERAVFILKEGFDYSHEEIASILDIQVPYSRQLLKRARQKLNENKRGPVGRKWDGPELSELRQAISQGDMEQLNALLSEEVRSVSDGGPKARASRKILYGKHRVSRFMQAIHGKYFLAGSATRFCHLNGMPSVLYLTAEGIYRCILFEMRGGQVDAIYIMVNPDKLIQLNRGFCHAEGP